MPTMQEYLAKRYDAVCPHCEHGIHVTRSMGMMAGWMDTGYGTCPYCNQMTQLKYDPVADTLTARRDDISDKVNAKRMLAKDDKPQEDE